MNEKIFRKEYKEVMKIWTIFAFSYFNFYWKNNYFKWIKEETPQIKF